MAIQTAPILKVEELKRYGKPLNDMPEDAFKGQGWVLFRKFREKFGLIGLIPFVLRVLWERRRLTRKYAQQIRELRDRVGKLADEPILLIAMFNAIARKESREEAYAFVKGIFQVIALKSLPALYQLEDLVRCEGDVFDNFKKFNVAMFEAGNDDYHVQEIEETEDHLRIVVDSCLNIDIGKMFDCPEIAMLGCDHDLASYPYVDPQVHSEFRRPCTLAKGCDHCEFNFYREGHAPEGPFENK